MDSVTDVYMYSFRKPMTHETLIDPTKRRAYETIWPGIRYHLREQQEPAIQLAEAANAKRQKETDLKGKEREDI